MIATAEGLKSVSSQRSAVRCEHLDGNVARRKFLTNGYIWDDELKGFALRHTAIGRKSWIVQYRHRQEVRRVTLGALPTMKASDARVAARRILAEAALDGLPARGALTPDALASLIIFPSSGRIMPTIGSPAPSRAIETIYENILSRPLASAPSLR